MWREQFPICQKDDQTEQPTSYNYARVELSAATSRTIAEQQKFSASLKMLRAGRAEHVKSRSAQSVQHGRRAARRVLSWSVHLRAGKTPRFRTIQVHGLIRPITADSIHSPGDFAGVPQP